MTSRHVSSDVSVQGTNDDAQISKLSCVKLGYFKDDYLKFFVRRGARRAPLINRGYYSRVAALRELLYQFLETGGRDSPKQIISLGAGFDTTWFHLMAEGLAPTKYIEIDFREVTSKKAAIISRTPEMHSWLGPDVLSHADLDAGRIKSERYALLPADLRDLGGLTAVLEEAGLNPELPTYVLAECMLVYLPPSASAALVSHFGHLLLNAIFVVYEQIKPDDAFGRQMLLNLADRGSPLLGLHATPDLAAHVNRFLEGGWQSASAVDMDTIYRLHLPLQDKARIERLELFDEFEEWHMIQEHYCIVVAKNDANKMYNDFGFKTYARLPPR